MLSLLLSRCFAQDQLIRVKEIAFLNGWVPSNLLTALTAKACLLQIRQATQDLQRCSIEFQIASVPW